MEQDWNLFYEQHFWKRGVNRVVAEEYVVVVVDDVGTHHLEELEVKQMG